MEKINELQDRAAAIESLIWLEENLDKFRSAEARALETYQRLVEEAEDKASEIFKQELGRELELEGTDTFHFWSWESGDFEREVRESWEAAALRSPAPPAWKQ